LDSTLHSLMNLSNSSSTYNHVTKAIHKQYYRNTVCEFGLVIHQPVAVWRAEHWLDWEWPSHREPGAEEEHFGGLEAGERGDDIELNKIVLLPHGVKFNVPLYNLAW